MASRRLTPLSKLLIVVGIVAAIFFGGKWLFDQGYIGGNNNNNDPDIENNDPGNNNNNNNGDQTNVNVPKDDDVIDIGVVTWGGYAAGQYWNKGFDANTESNFYRDYGFKVKFHVLDEFGPSRDAFRSGKVDLLWATIDAFPTETAGLADLEPQVVFQADWSRGGDAIVTRRGIRNVSDLKGKTVAVAPYTPSHTFLIWLLDANNMSTDDITIKEMESAINAADAFKAGTVDAAVVWSPDDEACVDAVPGSRILQNTKNASHIIADIFFARKEYINNNREKMEQLYEGWMKGAAELNSNPAKKKEAAKILAEGLNMDEGWCLKAIDNVRLTTHGDNLNFFGFNEDYKGVTGENLYNKMKNAYGDAAKGAKSYRLVSDKSIVRTASLNGKQHEAEGTKTFDKVTKADEKKEAIASKRVSITFPTGSYKLDENAKYIIDKEFTDLAKMFSNARIRVEGNTDNVGNRASNMSLSERRAQSVANFLKAEHGMDANRFIIVGNGPDKPVEGCEDNATDACKAKNRRTEFQLIGE